MKYAFLFIVLLFPFLAFSQTYYISPTGNDNNSGTSVATAWRTVQKAANTVPAGSTVRIRAGVYVGQVWVNVSGTANNYITFQPDGNGEVIIDGGSTDTQTELFVISGQDYIRVENLTIRNAIGNFSKGIFIGNGADHIQIVGCTFYDIHFSSDPNAEVTSVTNVNPIVVFNTNASDACTDILFENNEVYNCRTGFSESMTMAGNVDGFVIKNNLIHDVTNIGIDAVGGYGYAGNDPLIDAARNGVISENTTYNCVSDYAVSAGIYVDGAYNVVVERNRSYQNGRGYEIGAEQQNAVTNNVILRNNLAYRNLEPGVGIGGFDFPQTGKVENCRVEHNTFYDNNTEDVDFRGELLVEYTENCAIKNNIFYANSNKRFLLVTRLPSTGLDLNYNLYYHPQGAGSVRVDYQGQVFDNWQAYRNGISQDVNSIFVDPQLNDPANLDFQLQSNSPAIDAADPNFVPATDEKDYAGTDRVRGNRSDIGAYERATVLAVDDLPWTARATKNGVVLNWQVDPVTTYQYFVVEKSKNGSTFLPAKVVSAAAQSNYSWLDDTPTQGIVYYRLRAVAPTGKATLSTTISVNVNLESGQIFPNPATYYFTADNVTNVEVFHLYHQNGQLVRTFTTAPYVIGDLAKGNYVVVGLDAQQRRVFTEQLIIK